LCHLNPSCHPTQLSRQIHQCHPNPSYYQIPVPPEPPVPAVPSVPPVPPVLVPVVVPVLGVVTTPSVVPFTPPMLSTRLPLAPVSSSSPPFVPLVPVFGFAVVSGLLFAPPPPQAVRVSTKQPSTAIRQQRIFTLLSVANAFSVETSGFCRFALCVAEL
jgi:hypothetical protein